MSTSLLDERPDAIVVYGPQGCGKTLNARALAEHFGLDHIVEEWWPGELIDRPGLYLTSSEPPFLLATSRLLIVEMRFDDAMLALRARAAQSGQELTQ